MKKHLDISVIVVSFETAELTLACLDSVVSNTHDIEYEVIVVDNASKDGSAARIRKRFPEIELQSLNKNIGFARANNLASQQASGRMILLLNPDTIVLDGAIQRLVAFADEHAQIGVFGGRTEFVDGSSNPKSCWGRPTLWNTFCLAFGLTVLSKWFPFFGMETMAGWKRDSVREVDIVSGCFLLIRSELWKRLGGFDPAFFMYGEDFDLCMRARSMGNRCMFAPSARIIHYGNASEKIEAEQVVRQMRARVMLLRKHWRPWRAKIGEGLVLSWVLRRAVGLSVLSVSQRGVVDRARAWRTAWARRREWVSRIQATGRR